MQHFTAGAQQSAQLQPSSPVSVSLSQKKKPPLCCRRLPVFLQGGDNSRHWKLQTLARCLEECARRLSQRAHSQCLTPCLRRWIQDPRSWKKRDHEFKKKQMGVRTKRGRNGKRWLLESLHSSFIHLKMSLKSGGWKVGNKAGCSCCCCSCCCCWGRHWMSTMLWILHSAFTSLDPEVKTLL